MNRHQFHLVTIAAIIASSLAQASEDAAPVAPSAPVKASEPAKELLRGPYLQKAAPTQMTVRWRTPKAATGRVQFGAKLGALTSSVDTY